MVQKNVQDWVLEGSSIQFPENASMIQEFFKQQGANRAIDLDEAGEYGAAVQGTISQAEFCTVQEPLPWT